MTRTSMFCSSRWVAKLCRNVCSETRLLISAIWAAAWQARLSWRVVIGWGGSWAGERPARGGGGAIELARGHRLGRIVAREQPALRARRLPPGPQQVEQVWREHDVTVLAA